MRIQNIKLFCILMILVPRPSLADQPITLAFSPHQGATELVVQTIQGAKDSIRMAAYSFTSQPIAEALINACKHGIDVKIVIDKSQRKSGVLAHYFTSTCVELRVNSRYAIMHNKFIVVDGKVVQLGSFNYTKAAENKNAENVLVLHDAPAVANEYSLQWKKLWNEGADYLLFANTILSEGDRR